MNKRKVWLAVIIIIAALLAIANFLFMPKENKRILAKEKKQLPQREIKLQEQKDINETAKAQAPREQEEIKGEPLKGPLLN